MIDEHSKDPINSFRRRLLGGSALALAGLTLACSRSGAASTVSTAAAKAAPRKVDIVEFSNDGKKLRTVHVDKIVKSESEWRKILPPKSFNVARRAGTEAPFSGAYNNLHAKGVFRCICCDTALYDSAAKFESGTGWPSFWQPIAAANVAEHVDRLLGMERTEITCRRCDAHLGHVFDDGPQPTGLRYCMNSVALHFAAA